MVTCYDDQTLAVRLIMEERNGRQRWNCAFLAAVFLVIVKFEVDRVRLNIHMFQCLDRILQGFVNFPGDDYSPYRLIFSGNILLDPIYVS